MSIHIANTEQFKFIVMYLHSSSYSYQVRDGASSTAPLLGKFCGGSPPSGLIISFGSSMWLKFHSDGSVTKTGFLAYFKASYLSKKISYPSMGSLTSN